MLKDFINGKLLFCVGPEGYDGPMGVAGDAIDARAKTRRRRRRRPPTPRRVSRVRADWHAGGSSSDAAEGSAAARELEGLSPDDPLAKQLLAEMMDELGGWGSRRPERAETRRAQVPEEVQGEGPDQVQRVRRGCLRGWERVQDGKEGWDDAGVRASHRALRRQRRVSANERRRRRRETNRRQPYALFIRRENRSTRHSRSPTHARLSAVAAHHPFF